MRRRNFAGGRGVRNPARGTPGASCGLVMVEEPIGTVIVEGQRHVIWLRSEQDAEGSWHNALVFHRDGIHSEPEPVLQGVDWHAPPDAALRRARSLSDADRRELFLHALRPRPPLL